MSDLPPGPELDALIAERVFHWKWNIRNGVCYAEHDCFNAADCWPEFQPSTSIADVWTVVEKVWPLVNVGSGHGTYRFQLFRRDGDGMWICELATDPQGDWKTHRVGAAPTAPLAICYAALKAVK
jgi:Phage ABA sandwich domain